MIVASFTEVISIGSTLPFLAILTNPELVTSYIKNNAYTYPLISIDISKLLLLITIFFCLAAILAGFVRLVLLWAINKFSFEMGADISIKIFESALYKSYIEHVNTNSSELIDGVSNKSNSIIYGTILPLINLLSSFLILTFIFIFLLYLDYGLTLYAFFGFASIYYILIKCVKDKIITDSEKVATLSKRLIKILQESLGSIRDVILDNSQKIYINEFKRNDINLRNAQRDSSFISQSPRFLLESFGMILIALLAYVYTEDSRAISVLPLLGVLALGAQRMLPLVQQIYSSIIYIQNNSSSLEEVINLISKKTTVNISRSDAIKFNENIEITNVSFSYSNNVNILANINCNISKGDRVGIIGETGSGKSTLCDMIMFLLEPTTGTIKIDGIILGEDNKLSWQKKIAHVPQNLFLTDTTILENIAFGIDKSDIDINRVLNSIKLAGLESVIASLPDGYLTSVGERGIKLSGGQRQRIAIARALYRNSELIVLDEATSSLDNETENIIMEAIDGLPSSITLLIIAHRKSTLKNCNIIFEIKNKSIIVNKR
jgi:ATP-binding cassette subfamily B protein